MVQEAKALLRCGRSLRLALGLAEVPISFQCEGKRGVGGCLCVLNTDLLFS